VHDNRLLFFLQDLLEFKEEFKPENIITFAYSVEILVEEAIDSIKKDERKFFKYAYFQTKKAFYYLDII